ncbi:32524_t:CDS:2, partial [Racocetra persica]
SFLSNERLRGSDADWLRRLWLTSRARQLLRMGFSYDWVEEIYSTLKKTSPLAKEISEQEMKQNKEVDFAFAQKYQLSIKGVGFSHNRIFYDKYSQYGDNLDISGFFSNSNGRKEELMEIINQKLEKKQ